MTVSADACKRTRCLILILALAMSGSARGAGTPGAGAEEAPDGQSADDAAMTLYQEGIAFKETGLAREAAAAAADSAEERDRLLGEAASAFREAVHLQGRALKLDLDYYEAANELGFALRKSGDFRKALGAYNFALQIRPDFYPAIEYRGEAYLALGMLEQAKSAYLTLFQNDLTLAARLLAAMAGAETGDVAFERWVLERQRLAAVTPGADGQPGAHW